jgi:hypothetical protein
MNGVAPDARGALSRGDVERLSSFAASLPPHHRHNAQGDFKRVLHELREFVSDSSVRALAAGICWCQDDMVAVRVARLAAVLRRSKTQINELLASVSREALPISAERRLVLVARIPQLDDASTLRDWSFRRLKPESPGARQRMECPDDPLSPAEYTQDDAFAMSVRLPERRANLPSILRLQSHFLRNLTPHCADLPALFDGLPGMSPI